MAGNTGTGEMILLIDSFGADSRWLLSSFRTAGNDCPAVVIEDDGFLPEGILSVYGSFLGDFEQTGGRPRFFNEIKVPDYWEISGSGSNAKVNDLHRQRGKIFYAEPKHERKVKVVDWYDDRGVVRSSDHYNQYGALYARTVFNAKGQRVNKSYFSADGREIIVENYVTKDIILNDGPVVRFFKNKAAFVLFFLEKAGFQDRALFFNSLSTPFSVSLRAGGAEKRDVLFWQEPVRDEIPGNMRMILEGQAERVGEIVVQKRKSYDRLLELGAGKESLYKLGFVYSFERENGHRPEALICTNSDQIERLKEIVEGLPEMRFHIAAMTEMSPKLAAFGLYENVTLYPAVKQNILGDLFQACDYYFDINLGSEIASAVSRAFLNNQLILAFQETAHNKDYVADEHVYLVKDVEGMLTDVRNVMGDSALLDRHIKSQRAAALEESVEAYRRF